MQEQDGVAVGRLHIRVTAHTLPGLVPEEHDVEVVQDEDHVLVEDPAGLGLVDEELVVEEVLGRVAGFADGDVGDTLPVPAGGVQADGVHG